jgi:AAA domain
VKKPIMLGPVPITENTGTPTRMAILLWGSSGVGKTTFAATAPGVKLWLSFGDNEHVPVAHRKDVRVANLSELGFEELFKHAQSDNPFGLDGILADDEDIETVVCDSATAISFRALQKAVHDKVGAGKGFIPSMEVPGISAYGGRNAIVLQVLTGLLRVTARHNVHLIVTAHEDDPTYVKDGKNDVIDYIGMSLGGKLVNNAAWRLSEIWYMSQSEQGDKGRRIAIRPTRLRRPMKTRMFSDKGPAEFFVKYDADKPDKGQITIAGWYDAWLKGGKQKMPVPGGK